MRNIQEWLSENHATDAQQIFISDSDIKEPLVGDTIIIKDYTQLKNIYIKLRQINTLIIENSEQVEKIETRAREIKLIGNYSQLKTIKTSEQPQQPVIIEKEPILCWKCISIFIFFSLLLTILWVYINKKIDNFKNWHNKNCGRKNPKTKKPREL